MRALKALPTLLRVGFSEAVAYRAEMLVWVLATTMPFISLVLWQAVAEAGAVVSHTGRAWTGPDFTAYFLTVFIVRQLVSSWAAWEMNWEVRQGTLSMRLLRPVHPIVAYGAQNVAALPMRLIVAVPVAAYLLLTGAAKALPADPALWGLFLVSMLGGWLITFLANISIGALSLWMDSSVKVMDVYLAAFFVFSGYLFPLELFPDGVRQVAGWLPFRYQIGLPVELLTGARGVGDAAQMVLRQWAWVAALLGLALTLWNRGLRRFQAYGG